MVGPILGGSSDVALSANVAPLGDSHFDGCDLLRRRVIHARARKALEGEAQFSGKRDPRKADAWKADAWKARYWSLSEATGPF